VDYFSNANTSGAPDGTVRLTNPNTSGGNIWAAIYVFDPNQEMSECCECRLTPDGLRTLSVNSDLTSNPLTPVTLSTGLIKIVSTTGLSASKLFPWRRFALGLRTSRTATSPSLRPLRKMPPSVPPKSHVCRPNAPASSMTAAVTESVPAAQGTSFTVSVGSTSPPSD